MATIPATFEIPLPQMQAGAEGCISQVVGALDYVHRMNELGLKNGVVVEMVQPGDPCIVRLNGVKYCFRGNESLRILVSQSQ